jgi:hypothetical protein
MSSNVIKFPWHRAATKATTASFQRMTDILWREQQNEAAFVDACNEYVKAENRKLKWTNVFFPELGGSDNDNAA